MFHHLLPIQHTTTSLPGFGRRKQHSAKKYNSQTSSFARKNITHHTMSGLSLLNPNSDSADISEARIINIAASASIQNLLKTNLGPRGTLKMYVDNNQSNIQ